jgi:hypothetical protein
MKKALIAILVASCLGVCCTWAGSTGGFDFHLDSGVAFLRGSQLAPSAGVSIGLEGQVYGLEGYIQGQVFTQPGGNTSGANITSEFATEAGIRFLWRLFTTEKTMSRFYIDAGYFNQWLETPSEPNKFYRMHNGIMVRPGIGTILWTGELFQLEIGISYQFTLLPSYTDYNGAVITFRLF